MRESDKRRVEFERIARKYDRLARAYDHGAGRWVPEMRRRLVAGVAGEVLEIGIGTGANLPFYPAWFRQQWTRTATRGAGARQVIENRIFGIDASEGMLALARVKGIRLGLSLECRVMDVQDLTFPDHSFDAVVSTFCACVWDDPLRALAEIRRVCRPEGKVLMLEHSRPGGPLGVLLDVASPLSRFLYGCHLNRRTAGLIAEAGFAFLETTGEGGFLRSFRLSPNRPTATRSRPASRQEPHDGQTAAR